MDQRTESIKQEIDETRDSMTAHMEEIESQVYSTVDDVKGSAEHMVEQVRERIDIKRQVNEHPWTMLGASVLTGFVIGSLIGESGRPVSYSFDPRHPERRREYPPRQTYYYDEEEYFYGVPVNTGERREHGNGGEARRESAYRERSEYQQRERPEYQQRERPEQYQSSQMRRSASGVMYNLRDQFGDEIEALKQAAIRTASNSLRTLLEENIPQMADEFDRARHERQQSHQSQSSRSARSSGSSEDAEQSAAFRQTHQSSDTPTSIVAPETGDEEDKTFKRTHQSSDTASSIVGPEVEKQRS